MAITFGTYSSFESTVALLEAELPRLEEQRHTLERELAGVVERLEAVRSALGGLQSLSSAPLLEAAATTAAPVEAEPVADGAGAVAADGAAKRRRAASEPQAAAAAEPVPAQAGPARKTAAGKTAAARKKPEGKKAAGKATTVSAGTRRPAAGAAKPKKAAATAKAAPAKGTVAVAKAAPAGPKKRMSGLADGILEYLAHADGPTRAGDVAEALGREATPGSVNAVRTALERLVKASKAQRTGRGLYQALPR